MRNIEIKVKVEDLDEVLHLALQLGARDQNIQVDTDTYFRVPHGRLKLRVHEGVPLGTLIAYQRPDDIVSRISDYTLVQIDDPDSLRLALTQSLGILVTVRKSRRVLLYGATRIHLDDVEGLGRFVELETVLNEQTVGEAEVEHRHVLDALRLNQAEPVPVSYSDLLMTRSD